MYQSLKDDKDNLQLSFGKLNEEKSRFKSRVTKMGIEKATAEEKEKQYQTHIAALKENKNSLTMSLKSAME